MLLTWTEHDWNLIPSAKEWPCECSAIIHSTKAYQKIVQNSGEHYSVSAAKST